MAGLIPLTDASRRPVHFPIVTVSIIVANFLVFGLELSGGDAFVMKWSVIPANIIAGHHWITILTAMFLHGSWSHILGNMVFLWAFGPEIEDAMNRLRYLVFYLAGGRSAESAETIRHRDRSTQCPLQRFFDEHAISVYMCSLRVSWSRPRSRSALVVPRLRGSPGRTLGDWRRTEWQG